MNNEALISAHPIDPAMRVQILGCLKRLEADHDVKVLFACESGSRGGDSPHRTATTTCASSL